MDKSEKCYYAIIENKKRGKFSGTGPSQVAKKVASKKLKSGKEMEFYLDEVGSKKKRYGPYQATKDKKSGKVSVVKGKKVMKGGVLSSSDKIILTNAFNRNNQTEIDRQNEFIKQVEVDIRFYTKSPPFVAKSLLIFFKINNSQEQNYTHAIFIETNGIYIWILQQKLNKTVSFINFFDFFLNPDYSIFNNIKQILENLIQVTKLQIIRQRENNIIKSFLSEIESVITEELEKSKKAIYLPDYSQPLIRKCVYPDLTFGILDEQKPARIPQNGNHFQIPESNYQIFLILTNTGISGMSFNEPIIYVRVANIVQNQRDGTLTADQIDNYLKQIDELISKIETRNRINANQDTRKYLKFSKENIELTALSGIKKMNDDISKLEYNIMSYVLPLPQRIISNEDKQSQIIRLNKLKIILLEKKLQLQQIQPHQQFQLNNKQQELQQTKNKQRRQIQQLEQQLLHFDYCIYTNPTNRKELMIKPSNGSQSYHFSKYLTDINIINVCSILLNIPEMFGRLERVRRIAKDTSS